MTTFTQEPRRIRVLHAKLAVSIDMSGPWSRVLDGDWAGHVAQISFSIAFWVAIPLAAGVVRTVRRDVG